MKTAPTVSPEGHVILLYTDGSPCEKKNDTKYSAKVHLICNRVMVCAVCVCVHVCVRACVHGCVFVCVCDAG